MFVVDYLFRRNNITINSNTADHIYEEYKKSLEEYIHAGNDWIRFGEFSRNIEGELCRRYMYRAAGGYEEKRNSEEGGQEFISTCILYEKWKANMILQNMKRENTNKSYKNLKEKRKCLLSIKVENNQKYKPDDMKENECKFIEEKTKILEHDYNISMKMYPFLLSFFSYSVEYHVK